MTIIIWIVASLLIANLGKKTSWGYGGALLACLFLSPLIGLIIVLTLPKIDPEAKPKRGYLQGK